MVLYAVFIGLLLASYVAPLQQISESRSQISVLEEDIEELESDNAHQERAVEELQTPEGIERAARERYGMVLPGEEVYVVPEEPEQRAGSDGP